jgi:phosphotransferase system HPr-like phosphotransfer protein
MTITLKKIGVALALFATSYTAQAQQQTEEKYAVKVSFISYGAGVDAKASKVFEKFIADYSKKLTMEKNAWGREGEYDCCFKLSELKKRKQKKFVNKLKAEMKPYELVRITENTTCSKARGK